jgi:hypothetical protein
MSLRSAFISYSSDGSIKANQVSGFQKPMGVDTFLFEKDLDSGGHPSQKIKNAIRKRDALVMVLSAKSRQSHWVSHELGLASGMNKKILIIKTAHNLKLPEYIDAYDVILLSKLEDLDSYFESV